MGRPKDNQGLTFHPDTPNHPASLRPTTLYIDASSLVNPTAAPITPLLYAGFIEHLGRCIYGGIVDNPKAPSPASHLVQQPKGALGFRKDVMELLKEMEVPMIRWPGGEPLRRFRASGMTGTRQFRVKLPLARCDRTDGV